MFKILFLLLGFVFACKFSFSKQWVVVHARDFFYQGIRNPHAFVVFLQEDKTCGKVMVKGAKGFAPEKHGNLMGDGKIFDETNSLFNNSFFIEVEEEINFNRALSLIGKWNGEFYIAGYNDCVSFVKDVISYLPEIEDPNRYLSLLKSPTFTPSQLVKDLRIANKNWDDHSLNSLIFTLDKTVKENLEGLSFKISPQDVTLPTDMDFKWHEWSSAPADLKTAAKFINVECDRSLYQFANSLVEEGCTVKIAANDLNGDNIAGIAIMANNCESGCGIAGCVFRLYENGGSLKANLNFSNGVKPGKNCVIAKTTQFVFGFISGDNSRDARNIEELFRYKEKDDKPSAIPLPDGELIGGATPEELGRLILKAVKTNDSKLFKALIHPESYKRDADPVEMNLSRLREKLPEYGLTNWSLIKFNRVTFTKEGAFTDDGGITEKGEQVRRNFKIDFSYGVDFIGAIESMTILTYKGKYFIYSGAVGWMNRR